MKAKRRYKIILSVMALLLYSCTVNNSNKPDSEHIAGLKPVVKKDAYAKNYYLFSIDDLLYKTDNEVKFDTLVADSPTYSFTYFKKGSFLKKDTQTAVFIHDESKTCESISLYQLEGQKWILKDCLGNMSLFGPEFGMIYKDYNFDGVNDVYIQTASSNGYVLSRGILLTVDPKTMKFTRHFETEKQDLCNIEPDPSTHMVMSEDVDYTRFYPRVCILINKWENGKLKTVNRHCKETALK